MKLKYIGHTEAKEQVFVNPDLVVAILDNGEGKAPTEVLCVGLNPIVIVDKSWSDIQAMLIE